jgi:flagellin-like protein
MLTKKVLKSKKAISPILATLLLIVIAVAAIVVTYSWIMMYMTSAGEQAGVTLYKGNVYWNSTEKKTYITIGNSGTTNGKIVAFYIGNEQSNTLNVTTSTNIGSGIMVNAKSTVTIVLSWPNDLTTAWTAGNYYYFKVSTDAGQVLGPFPEQAAQ